MAELPVFSGGTTDAPATAPGAPETPATPATPPVAQAGPTVAPVAATAAPAALSPELVQQLIAALAAQGVLPTPGRETAVSEHIITAAAPPPDELFYVWLADGSKPRVVKEKDLPPPAGTNAQLGLWVEDGKTYHIAAIHPVEYPR